MWFNAGKVTHTVTSSSGVAGFSSPALAPMASFSFTFSTPGSYNYSCLIHPWMHGRVTVANPIPYTPPPISSSFMPTISLDGSIGWTVNGLDNSVAVLNVSHQVSIVASVGPASFTPVTETGSFSQSVILGIIQRMLASYPGYYGYYGYSPGIGQLLSSQKEVYTFWWVNGPLSNG